TKLSSACGAGADQHPLPVLVFSAQIPRSCTVSRQTDRVALDKVVRQFLQQVCRITVILGKTGQVVPEVFIDSEYTRLASPVVGHRERLASDRPGTRIERKQLSGEAAAPLKDEEVVRVASFIDRLIPRLPMSDENVTIILGIFQIISSHRSS